MVKKSHTAKILIISNEKKKILFISESYHRSCHDYTMLKTEFDPTKGVWLDDHEVWVVLIAIGIGFLGIRKDYCTNVKIPNKKPKGKTLAKQQKQENTTLSKDRIIVEHSIGAMKRYQILANQSGIKNVTRYNQITGICVGLWNFYLNH